MISGDTLPISLLPGSAGAAGREAPAQAALQTGQKSGIAPRPARAAMTTQEVQRFRGILLL